MGFTLAEKFQSSMSVVLIFELQSKFSKVEIELNNNGFQQQRLLYHYFYLTKVSLVNSLPEITVSITTNDTNERDKIRKSCRN